MTKAYNEREGELSLLASSSESEEGEEYQPTQTQPFTPTTSTSTDSTACASSSIKKFKDIFQSPEVEAVPWSCACCRSCCTSAWP